MKEYSDLQYQEMIAECWVRLPKLKRWEYTVKICIETSIVCKIAFWLLVLAASALVIYAASHSWLYGLMAGMIFGYALGVFTRK